MNKLSDEELKDVAGGLIVSADGKYYVVHDRLGVTFNSYTNYEQAREAALLQYGSSDEVISVREYEARYNRKFMY